MRGNGKLIYLEDFPGGPVVKALPCNAEEAGLIPGQGSKILHPLRPKNQTEKILQQIQ